MLRFFGPQQDLLAAEAPRLAVYDSNGTERFRVEIEGLLDATVVGTELWAILADRVVRMSARDRHAFMSGVVCRELAQGQV